MALQLTRLALLAFLVLGASAANAQPQRDHYDRVAPADKQFADVVLDLEQAIGDENFAIVGRNDIGDAVRRRGHADFPDAVIVQFCNLEYARQVIEIDPSYMLYMPCRVVAFEQDGRVHAASLLLPTETERAAFNELATTINAAIRRIVDFAVVPLVPSK
ncbi:DUF302 domain-containing protein [Salinisphaera orenii]|uniref:DUF302 domain-containing protein n=1 Tax=Salinisphaera orenii YIM 95161 TaxID=1051139 RepID=A0A423PMB4_9GAMM|nr:DUF302 domain-containing protein [Salinisphaera halophila]ROO26746.1 hypothetical protein SAHL_12585 [Salinisphaera halophila YIM 95161]